MEKKKNNDLYEIPRPEAGPLRTIWSYFLDPDPPMEEVEKFPTLLNPENDAVLWQFFNEVVIPIIPAVPAADSKDYDRILQRRTDTAEKLEKSKMRSEIFKNERS